MRMKIHWRGVAGLLLGIVMLSAGVISASAHGSNSMSPAHPASILSSARSGLSEFVAKLGVDDEGQGQPGAIDDGKDLLPQAKITLDQAIKNAEAAHPGKLGEVDLEHYHGHLVFNVDMGSQDVKVDALDGTVLGSGSD
jgi:hypothetical protein